MSALENRGTQRHEANFLLHYAGSDLFGFSYTRNISHGGCFVETESPVEKGTRMDIEMFVDLGDKALPIVAQAKVMWTNYDTSTWSKLGMGLSFVAMDPEATELLNQAIDYVCTPQAPIPTPE